jgi:hypothetical protein
LKTETRPKTETRRYELMAAVYNDPTFNPVTQILLQNHMDYTEEIDLSHSKVEHMSEATPDKCQEKYSSMTLALKRQIASWEASGQGEGGMLFGDDGEEEHECSSTFEFGQLTGRPQRALERRANFFSDVPSYLLYLWDMIETHDLRRSCLQTLVASVAAGDGGANVPSLFDNDGNDNNDDGSLSVSSKSTKSAASQTGVKELSVIGEGMKKFHDRSIQLQRFEEKQKAIDRDHASKERLLGEIDNLKREKRQYKWQLITHNSKRARTDDDDPTSAAMQGFVDNLQSDIQDKEKEVNELDNHLNSIANTPRRNNRTP